MFVIMDYPIDNEELHKMMNVRIERFKKLVLDLRGKSIMIRNLAIVMYVNHDISPHELGPRTSC